VTDCLFFWCLPPMSFGTNLTPEAVERIISTTGLELRVSPLDPAAVSDCIMQCDEWYRRASFYSLKKLSILSAATKAAKRLQQVLLVDSIPLREIDLHRNEIKALLREIEQELAYAQSGPGKAMLASLSTRSPFEWIAGNFLADAYFIIFRQKPSYSENGPFVRFVEATLRELEITRDGKSYSRMSIAKARKDDELNKFRRASSLRLSDDYRSWRRQLLLKAFTGER
jgi:hypothetical protein